MMSETVFHWTAISWLALGVALYPLMLRITAPYGRHAKLQGKYNIDNRLGWLLMELPALVLVPGLVVLGGSWQYGAVRFFTGLWVGHYFYRAIIFPAILRTPGKKMPILILLSAFGFNLVNGFLNGYWLGWLESRDQHDLIVDARVIIGTILFGCGFLIHLYHDRTLIGLRKRDQVGYQIPRVGLFRLVSCPNFLGEIIQWAGFALMTWNFASLSFLVWTIANLSSRAGDHHRWYQQTFADYPPNRRALVPWIY